MKIGFPGALFIVFLILKLTGVIAWSWWWVTCPMWIIPLIYLVLFAGFLCGEIYKKSNPNSRTVFCGGSIPPPGAT